MCIGWAFDNVPLITSPGRSDVAFATAGMLPSNPAANAVVPVVESTSVMASANVVSEEERSVDAFMIDPDSRMKVRREA
jgi:hypothetical protein